MRRTGDTSNWPRPAREGAVYALVLIVALLLTVIALAGVSINRVNARANADSGDWSEAQMLAYSGAEHAMAMINADSSWRTTYATATVQKSLGRGTFSWRLVDQTDGNLTDDPTEPFVILSTGTVGNATYTLRVAMKPATAGLTAGVSTPTTISMSSNSVIDSYDSGLGSYGGTNRGSAASVASATTAAGGVSLSSNSQIKGNVQVGVGGNPNTVISPPSAVTGSKTAMSAPPTSPTVTEPTGMGAASGNLATGNNQTIVVSSDRHVNAVSLSNNSTIQINGAVTILVEGAVTINNNAKIQVLPGASLKLYFKGALTVENNAVGTVVDGANLSRLQLLGLGTAAVTMQGNAALQGVIIAPNAPMTLGSNAQLLGAVFTKSLTMSSNAAVHEDKRITNGTDPVNVGSTGSAKPKPTAWTQVVN